ncbi:ATP-binding cassette domain-containing protein [Ilumatobacter sp.]|uniref:branched-chain amino acid ABC transporter ATP-binding protein/permease n=1 Tax=Ilumatobacter sp. TaxID=1967498 RepID=UPI0037529710
MEIQITYLNSVLIFTIFALSLNLLLGYAGQVSVAHAAFGAIGGYTVGYLYLEHDVGLLPGLVVGVLLSALAGLIVGLPALRLSTEFLILLTLATQTIILTLVTTNSSLGGTYGLQGLTGLSVFGDELILPSDFLPYLFALAVIVYLIVRRFGESPYGRVLRGIREDEVVCRSLGKNVFVYKLTVFSVTAAIAGLAGVLLAAQTQLASPSLFSFDQSTAIIAMVILGGSGNLLGSVLGATLLVLLTPFFQNVLSFAPEKSSLWRLIAYGAVLVVVMLVRPQGLLPEGTNLGTLGRRLIRRRTSVADDAMALALPGQAIVNATTTQGDPDGDAHALTELAHHGGLPATEGGDWNKDEVVLSVVGLTKRFGGITAAEDLKMELRRGRITALVGPNGAGKTTVFNLLTGAIRPDAGQITLHGKDITGFRPDQVANEGMARSFQDVRVFPRLSVLENVMIALQGQVGEHTSGLFLRPKATAQSERATRDRAMEWLSFVGMDSFAEYQAGALAFGQQKLVALARVLATDAEVVLLDEPASGIDQQWVEVMLGLIELLRDQGRTICIVEHNLHVVGRLADHTYFMELGRITAQGSFEELTNESRLAEAYFGTA